MRLSTHNRLLIILDSHASHIITDGQNSLNNIDDDNALTDCSHEKSRFLQLSRDI